MTTSPCTKVKAGQRATKFGRGKVKGKEKEETKAKQTNSLLASCRCIAVGEALAAPLDDLPKVLIVSEPTFRVLKAVFLTFSYCCLFVPWSGWKSRAPACVIFVFISDMKSYVFHPHPQTAGKG